MRNPTIFERHLLFKFNLNIVFSSASVSSVFSLLFYTYLKHFFCTITASRKSVNILNDSIQNYITPSSLSDSLSLKQFLSISVISLFLFSFPLVFSFLVFFLSLCLSLTHTCALSLFLSLSLSLSVSLILIHYYPLFLFIFVFFLFLRIMFFVCSGRWFNINIFCYSSFNNLFCSFLCFLLLFHVLLPTARTLSGIFYCAWNIYSPSYACTLNSIFTSS